MNVSASIFFKIGKVIWDIAYFNPNKPIVS